jgi:transposase InsO family protein
VTHGFARNRRKPPWVTDKVLYLKAISGNGCGKVAETFNRLYGHKETVSKSFVYEKLKRHQYQLMQIKRHIRNKPPRKVPINKIWAMDLTTVTWNNQQKQVLGIIDHGSRLCLRLVELESQHSASILIEVCKAIKQFGLPQCLRTDNEKCFTSRKIKLAFKLLGIKPQTTDIASPWQNGRIERYFLTFKTQFKQAIFDNSCSLQTELTTFNIWYNQLRTHENLGGLTPKETWLNRKDKQTSQAVFATAWDGLLTGFYFPD